MEKRPVPYKKTVFVCTNKREGGRVACANPGRGGDEICASLKDAVKHMGLKGQIRIARSGCLDLCEKGPNLFVEPGGTWYCGIQEGDVPELLKKLTE
jgi:(2Fe-2S) ferredoxin